MTFGESCLPPRERERERESHNLLSSKAHTLEFQDRGLSHRLEDLGCKRPPWMQGYSTRDVHRLCARKSHRMRTWTTT